MTADSRVVRHSSEFGDWEAVHRAPHASLAPYVRRMSGWWERTTFTRRREVPFVGAVLIININNRLRVSEPTAPERMTSFHAFFGGLTTSYVVTESSGYGGGIQVDFTPLGAYLFTGVPAHEFADRVIEYEDFGGIEARILTDQLESTPNWEERFELVEAAILARMARAPRASEGVAWAAARLEAEHGLVSISELTRELGWSPRQLIDGFRREVGLAPKQVARIHRFDRAVKMLTPGTSPCFADIAAACGYYDQAHFAREFREFAGCTPTQHYERLVPESGGVLDDVPGQP
ncbi:MAG: helix-turn-helix domain-containing protein [Tepidiformaceae bacterium]